MLQKMGMSTSKHLLAVLAVGLSLVGANAQQLDYCYPFGDMPAEAIPSTAEQMDRMFDAGRVLIPVIVHKFCGMQTSADVAATKAFVRYIECKPTSDRGKEFAHLIAMDVEGDEWQRDVSSPSEMKRTDPEKYAKICSYSSVLEWPQKSDMGWVDNYLAESKPASAKEAAWRKTFSRAAKKVVQAFPVLRQLERE